MPEKPARDETRPAPSEGVPMPIVTLNRWTLLTGILIALLTRQPWITTLLLAMLLPAIIGGQRWSPIAAAGRRLFASRIPKAEREDQRLMRFNNTIAATLLGLSQIAFFAGVPSLGWVLSSMVALAAAVALVGFCVGCFLFFRFRMFRYRVFGK